MLKTPKVGNKNPKVTYNSSRAVHVDHAETPIRNNLLPPVAFKSEQANLANQCRCRLRHLGRLNTAALLGQT